MKITCKTLKIIGYTILSIVGLVLFYLLAALVLSSITVNKTSEAKAEVYIFILTNGVHTDIVMPVKTDLIDWSKDIRFDDTKGKDSTYNYLAVGWGDKTFYLETPEWADLKASTALGAMFGLDQSAIHSTYYRHISEDNNCRRIGITQEQYRRLVEYIQSSFARDANGNIIHIPTDAVYGSSDSFYEATGRYSLVRTCNTWANDALKSCEQKACLWTPFQSFIFKLYR